MQYSEEISRRSEGCVSGPGAEEGEHFVRAVEISSPVRGVQSAKGRRMEGRDRGGGGGKK